MWQGLLARLMVLSVLELLGLAELADSFELADARTMATSPCSHTLRNVVSKDKGLCCLELQ